MSLGLRLAEPLIITRLGLQFVLAGSGNEIPDETEPDKCSLFHLPSSGNVVL